MASAAAAGKRRSSLSTLGVDPGGKDPEGHIWCFGTYRPTA